METLKRFFAQSKLPLVVLGFALFVILNAVDYFTHYNLGFSIFYLIPVLLITWTVGRFTGLLICAACGAIWYAMNTTIHTLHTDMQYWNTTVRVIFFAVIVYSLSILKTAYERERQSARKDFLTGIPNRYAFFEGTLAELKKAGRNKYPVTLAYVDCDNLKKINDRFGHPMGDAVLRSVATTMIKNVRPGDIVARLGGDEFVVLLPDTTEEGAQTTLQKLQNTLNRAMASNGWAVTFSIGAVTFPTPPTSVDEMLKKTDSVMYSVKNDGKNMLRQKTVSG